MALPSQGGLMQLACAVPIRNPSFRLPTLFSAKINNGAGYAAGTTVFNIDGESPGNGDSYLAVGDSLTLGPSTDTTDSGKTENLVVASVTATSVTTNASSIAVDDNDPVSAVGNLCPGGWTPTNIDTLYNIYTFGGGNRGVIGSGYMDNYRLKFDQDTDGGYIQQTIGTKWFLAGKYRAGAFAKVAAMGASDSIKMRVSDGTSEFINKNLLTSTVAPTDWTERLDTARTAVAGSGSPYIKIIYVKVSGNSTGIEIDDPFLEHAIGTDDAANGFYEFDEYPDAGSVSWEPVMAHKIQRLPVNTIRMYHPAGLSDRTPKHVFNCEFSNVSQTFIDNLRVFMYWQEKGWTLALHPGLDDLPPTIFGILRIPLISKDHWDLSYHRFSFSFLEI